jgi:hypothetical protein
MSAEYTREFRLSLPGHPRCRRSAAEDGAGLKAGSLPHMISRPATYFPQNGHAYTSALDKCMYIRYNPPSSSYAWGVRGGGTRGPMSSPKNLSPG